MAYLLKHATRPDRIAEREWAVGQAIKFAAFTSCIGLIARVTGRDKVIGIHLSLMDASSQWIGVSDINQVVALLHEWRYDAQSMHIVGFTDLWSETDTVNAAYKRLKGLWENAPEKKVLDDGTLAVRIMDGRMTFTYTYSKDGRVESFCFPKVSEEPAEAPVLGPLDAAIAASTWFPRARARSV